MFFKKAFTLAELTVVMSIVAVLLLVVVSSLKGNIFEKNAQIVLANKIIRNAESAIIQIIESEKTQCPEEKFMSKLPGGNWEYILKNGTEVADSTALIELFGKYLKYDSGVMNFCDKSTSCTSENIKGAKLVGGGYIGIEVLSSISDCAAYYFPGVEEEISAPTEFVNGENKTKKCWGKLYINAQQGGKPSGIAGQDEFILNLGEYGIEK